MPGRSPETASPARDVISAPTVVAPEPPVPAEAADAAATEALRRQLRDLQLMRAAQEVRLARLGALAAEALAAADRAARDAAGERSRAAALGRDLERAAVELAGERARAEAARERSAAEIAGEKARADALAARLAETQGYLAFLESTRALRLRRAALRLRGIAARALGRAPARMPAEATLPATARTSVAAQPASRTASTAPAAIPPPEVAAPASRAEPIAPAEPVPPEPAARPSVLFVSHDCQPHGAQIFLLRLLRWLRERTDLPFEVLVGRRGVLLPEFARLARVSIWEGAPEGPLPESDPLVQRLRAGGVSLVYANTIVNGEILRGLSTLGCPVITHVHELGFWMRNRVDPAVLAIVRERTTRFLAVSQAVRRALERDAAVPTAKVALVHGFVPVGDELPPGARAAIRRELAIPEGAAVVGGCGTLDWRKAPDLFVQVCREVARGALGARVHFLWVGGNLDSPEYAQLAHDLALAGIASVSHFTGHREDARDLYAAMDVFVLPSREDPFPLVVMEAAARRVPTVCFDEAGGAREFVEDDCGFVVPYLDVHAMAGRVSELLADDRLRRRFGAAAAAKVRARHDVAVIAPKILAEIERFVGRAARTE